MGAVPAVRKDWLVHHRGASDHLSTGGIDGLRIHLPLAEKEQLAGRGIDTGIGINQTMRVRVVELADIETWRVAQHVKNKMTAVTEKLRDTVAPVSRLHPRHGDGALAPFADTRKIGLLGVGVKRISPSRFHVPPTSAVAFAITRTDSAVKVHPLEFPVGKESRPNGCPATKTARMHREFETRAEPNWFRATGATGPVGLLTSR